MTRLVIVSLASLVIMCTGNAYAVERPEIKLWEAGLPKGSVQLDPAKVKAAKAKTTVERIAYVDEPSITVFQPAKESANGCAVVICPGGGYNILAWPKEGLEVAEWFNTLGVTAFVLKYRVPRRIPDNIHWEPMQDVQRAIRLVRHRAKNWDLDPDRIGVLGFSAGGHLTVMAGVQYETKCYEPTDEADAVSAKPNFICPIYAAYLGDEYNDGSSSKLGSLVKVTKQTPPTFMAVTWDDKMRGAQAATLFAKLRENGVPAELHIYARGGHGYGMRVSDHPVSRWNARLKEWMMVMGYLKKNGLGSE